VVLLVAGFIVADAAFRDTVLKGAGGVLLLLGSYYGARTLKETHADRNADRILKAIELAGSSDRIVRLGAAEMLRETARDIDDSSGTYENPRIAIINRIFDELARKYPEDARDFRPVERRSCADDESAAVD
jgi:hypothetical protein